MNESLHRSLADRAWREASLDECPGTTAWKVLYEKKLIEFVVWECFNIAYAPDGILEHFGLNYDTLN